VNERIQLLAEQATTRVDAVPNESMAYTYFDTNMFAQLIVQECIDLISPYTVRMSRPGEEYLHPILEIRKHFGVAE